MEKSLFKFELTPLLTWRVFSVSDSDRRIHSAQETSTSLFFWYFQIWQNQATESNSLVIAQSPAVGLGVSRLVASVSTNTAREVLLEKMQQLWGSARDRDDRVSEHLSGPILAQTETAFSVNQTGGIGQNICWDLHKRSPSGSRLHLYHTPEEGIVQPCMKIQDCCPAASTILSSTITSQSMKANHDPKVRTDHTL